ncbi:MAG: 4Fe-4S dicluster domain-containing protein [Candidatus Thermoplasmatota archaeon]|nr:4Fe-4S dicluster domain-containing protein [Candidatus Thermoplasmatota archaeon]
MTENASMTDLFNMSNPVKTDSRELDRELKVLGLSSPNICFQCSRCTSGCEAMKLLELQPHSIMASARSGFIQEIIQSDVIWTCVGCYKCKERCPQDVSPVEVMCVLKNWYVASGKPIPGDYQNMLQNMITNGFIQGSMEVLDTENNVHGRGSLGLPEIKGPLNLAKFAGILSRMAVEKL